MRELVLLCPGALAEPLSDALLEGGALSVSVDDADSDTYEHADHYSDGDANKYPNLYTY